ncbi:MAG: hypothetical protein PUJ51_24965 [Clostridiales bacterium]|uniref:hypothetical protein n=1 Tax=Terrisporobacter sp. TaxID=1965305 RepID=UPI002A4E58F3|nr:hypothetical protein [Terrisporobacter sp.]MDD7757709.1 hypothetical protein [Clostridiales bacterium]MDY3778356.1 hypothetical protein [Candidatus Onthovivens sp.]MDY4136444.1 hypothetical protein [Terrisporobacter sp.]
MNNNLWEYFKTLHAMNMTNNALLLGIAKRIGIKNEEIDELIKIGTNSAVESLKELDKERENKENGK